MSFQVGSSLSPDSPLFYGRKAELYALGQQFGPDGSVMIVYGGPLVGKTSLIRRFARDLTAQYRVVLVNFRVMNEALGDLSEATVYPELARRIALALELPPPADITGRRGFIPAIHGLLTHAPRLRSLLVLEDWHRLTSDMRRKLANTLRAMFEGRVSDYPGFDRLHVVLTGGVELYSLQGPENSPLSGLAEQLSLGDLNAGETSELISTGLTASGVSAEAAAVVAGEIYGWTGGHPYLTQRFGQHLLGQYKDAAPLDARAVERAAALMRRDMLIRDLKEKVDRHRLMRACRALWRDQVPISEFDTEMVKLEILGLAKAVDGVWVVRNRLFAEAIDGWINRADVRPPDAVPEDVARQRDLLRTQREMLRIERKQLATFGAGYAPAHLVASVEQRCAMIRQLKEELIAAGFPAEPDPNDE
jgi:hypothetical protein